MGPQTQCYRPFCGVVCFVTLPFWHFCWRMGFCHRTESDLFLFLKMSQPIICLAGHLVLLIRLKNTNMVKGVKFLLPVKFWQILFSEFREEVENVSANQKPRRPFLFSDWPEKHNLVDYVEFLLPVRFWQIPLSGFREELSRICVSESEAGRPSCFWTDSYTQTLWRTSSFCFLSSFGKICSVVIKK